VACVPEPLCCKSRLDLVHTKLAFILTTPFPVSSFPFPAWSFSNILHVRLVAGATVTEDTTDVSSYSYDSAKKEFVSYDTPNIIKIKTQYINSKGLAGSMFWEVSRLLSASWFLLTIIQLSTDKVGADSLVGTATGLLGSLDETQNHIRYFVRAADYSGVPNEGLLQLP